MKKLLATILIAGALAALVGCTVTPPSSPQGYPGFGTPRAALDTFFSSKLKSDFETTWLCYYKHYGDKVTKTEFIRHSKDDPSVLTGYVVRSVNQSGTAEAAAQVSLTFKTKDPKNPVQHVNISEHLVNESGLWRIKVW